MSFHLDTFLANYVPKTLKSWLDPYMKTGRLDDYELYTKKNINKLCPNKTYIKYIKINQAHSNKNYSSHIKCGGILLAGGYIIDRKFKKSNDKKSWTHLLLKYDPSDMIDDNGKIIQKNFDPYTYIINMSKVYIFFKLFGYDIDNLLIELVGSTIKND